MKYIPLDNLPNHNFDITLSINKKNTTFNIFTSYNERHYWTIQFRDKNKNPITDSIPLLSGENLFQGLEYLNIGELYLIPKSELVEEVPDVETIGTDYWLLWRENDAE